MRRQRVLLLVLLVVVQLKLFAAAAGAGAALLANPPPHPHTPPLASRRHSIMVPYHGWRISHRTHHANHGHIENDESWTPTPK